MTISPLLRLSAAAGAVLTLAAWAPLPGPYHGTGLYGEEPVSQDTVQEPDTNGDEAGGLTETAATETAATETAAIGTGAEAQAAAVPANAPTEAAVAAIFQTMAGEWNGRSKARIPLTPAWVDVPSRTTCVVPVRLTLRCTSVVGGERSITETRFLNGTLLTVSNPGTAEETVVQERITTFAFTSPQNWWMDVEATVTLGSGSGATSRRFTMRERRAFADDFYNTIGSGQFQDSLAPPEVYLQAVAARAE